ncbi:MAG: hypothetical protein V7609_535 [Verrucomicrobiota bacterium]
MNTDQQQDPAFLQTLRRAVSKLKNRLQRDYERAYPGLRDVIRIVLDEEEAKAWESSFPQLLLPDLVEAHIAQLGLNPAESRHENFFTTRDFTQIQNQQPAFA